ncbi:MBL fold metallo-hydrolase [Virgibacillus halodenitrificans]|jgi:competence protein ComEC|uniref:MBL fold metallo-hydrolase n=1 Tax=Virgibacillus halodenitrificans TaxID=1482 RepID=A0ABR7VPW1_VIRHA|nr:MBL fold metallo-hydrolase [Virgibacillus halodenitrificans]MBD1223688.1 MBL fold metallo-hydrolase [Virgibacillus halodenitrificans]MCG1028065.1 MBL fold metallo-hydrolase [Virgibacillus halodenitrificans]MCJ0933205.1 MBL fold metallo-hydrolase [Virgibacillus halodenitrificans]MEC2159317.1 MBL fold metallo-hydrolase [Virgibacillus halodenitrificans]MYL58591.1 MBL fold metallo-hydrolase [Virgibacillus halodenitrificans]
MVKNTFFLFIVFFTVITLFPASSYAKERQMDMEVHFIDVGQGDSILVQTPQNKNILIDGGPPDAGERIVSYLKKEGIKSIDLLVVTHPDVDHIGGLPHVMGQIPIKKIVDSGKLHTTRTYGKYVRQIRKQEIPVQIAKIDDQLKVDSELKIQILNAFEKMKTNNQSSIVLKLTYNKMDFLLMSDVEIEQEKEFIKKHNLQAEILKVAHHGSNTSTSLGFLKEVSPQVAILTYSKQNDYGHPVDRVIRNLTKVNSFIYSTAAFGNIVIRTDGINYLVEPEQHPVQKMIEEVS